MDAPLAPAVAVPVAPSEGIAPSKSIAGPSIVSAAATAGGETPIKPDTDDAVDPLLLSLVRRSFPPSAVVKSLEVLSRVKQANAEGARVRARFVVSSSSKEEEEQEEEETRELFVKVVDAARIAPTKKKGWADLRRSLVYARTEARFYSEFLPRLEGSGSSTSASSSLAPRCHLAEYDLSGLIGEDESSVDVGLGPVSGSAGGGEVSYDGRGGFLVLSAMNPSSYYQRSPLTVSEASTCLSAVARLHGAAWENASLLTSAAKRLGERGGSYHLSIRNPSELKGMEESWSKFRSAFAGVAPEVLDRPGVVDLGRRIGVMAEWVCERLSPGPDEKYATIVHGDYKAMNVFLPVRNGEDPSGDDDDEGVLMIDFASTGVGMGMSDVAMHVVHAIRPEDLANGGEERLVDGYLDALHSARVRAASASTSSTASVERYPRDVAHRHYRLAVVDYFRFVCGRFYGSATPEMFEKKKDLENRTLVNRDVPAAVAFVDRVDRYLAEFERERREENEEAAGA